MLGKLLKHEFKATGKMLPISYIATAVFIILCWIAKLIFKELSIGYVSFVIIAILSIVFVLIFTFIVIISRFYKSMFGNEGYLTQTIPVKKSTLLLSRIIVFLTWYIISMIVIVIAALALIQIISGDWRTFWNEFMSAFGSSPYVLFILTSMIIQSIEFAFAVFFSISLANTSNFLKNNIAFSFVFYIVLNIIIVILQILAMLFIPLSIETNYLTGESSIVSHSMLSWMADIISDPSLESSVQYIGIGTIFVDIIIIIALCLLTNWLLKKKVNVK